MPVLSYIVRNHSVQPAASLLQALSGVMKICE
jgi:hypothetical protein